MTFTPNQSKARAFPLTNTCTKILDRVEKKLRETNAPSTHAYLGVDYVTGRGAVYVAYIMSPKNTPSYIKTL